MRNHSTRLLLASKVAQASMQARRVGKAGMLKFQTQDAARQQQPHKQRRARRKARTITRNTVTTTAKDSQNAHGRNAQNAHERDAQRSSCITRCCCRGQQK